MKSILVFALVAIALTLESFGTCCVAAQPALVASDDDMLPQPSTFFQTYCVGCHGADSPKGEISLHLLDENSFDSTELEKWDRILGVLESGEMPPDGQRGPDSEERNSVMRWIDGRLRYAIEATSRPGETGRLRRLTNFEYHNTMRDLLGFELRLTDNLPEDPVQPYRFNNSAEFMLIGPEQIDRYLENARRAMAASIVDPIPPEVHRKVVRYEARGDAFTGLLADEIGVFGNRRNTAASAIKLTSFPASGEYRIRIEAAAILPPGFDEVPLQLVMGTELRHDAGTGDFAPVGTVILHNDVEHLQWFEFRGRIENHPVQVGQVTDRGQEPRSLTITPQNLFDDGRLNDHRKGFDDSWSLAVPRVVMRSLEFEAPVVDVWPPAHHTRILFESPLRESDPAAYVREVLRRFMTRAFRRPVTTEELDRFVRLHDLIAGEFDSFEAAMRETLAMVLISPQFLYHTVADGHATTSDYELASRLSYFLWGSMPDEELSSLADRGELNDPEVVEVQVQRMLDDPKSREFVENFVTQWLSLAKTKAVKINLDLYPRFLYTYHLGERRGEEVAFRPTIRDDMIEESIGFVAEMIRRNASVMDLVDSDYAWLNERLAAHYGVSGVQGSSFRVVPLSPEHRLGGLLTHGSILIGNSTGSAPHPIYRAVWLREAILGDEVPPPPAEVPALTDSAGDAAETAATIKELLRVHRAAESCRDCHSRLDPWGIPFEHHDAVGRFRERVPAEGTRVRGFQQEMDGDLSGYGEYLDRIATIAVEADAEVPGGPVIDGLGELKDYLIEQRSEDIAENIVRRFLTYALGRQLTYRDRFIVERLMQETRSDDYRMRDVIIAICRSETFRSSQGTTE